MVGTRSASELMHFVVSAGGRVGETITDWTKAAAIDRLYTKTIVVNDCWVFTGDPNRKGEAPHFQVDKVTYPVPNYVFRTYVGVLLGDRVVCHTCDNNRCWNIKHLYAGTPYQNMQDMIVRGRQKLGVELPHTVLTTAQVEEIKKRLKNGGSPKPISIKMNISYHLVIDIACGRAWNHVRV